MKNKGRWVMVSGLLMLVLLLSSLDSLSATTTTPPATTITPMKLRFGSVWAPPDVFYASYEAKLWMDMVTERTNGAITFGTNWGGGLGTPPEYFNMTGAGVLDIGQATTLYKPTAFPLADYGYACLTGPDLEIETKAHRQLTEEFPQFDQDFAKQNLIAIATTPIFQYTFASKEPIRSLADFAGKKVAVIGKWPGKWLTPIGAVPVVAPGQERYTMAQMGVADVDLLPMDHQWGYKILEVLPYFLESTGLAHPPTITIFMNLDKFNKLPPEVQKILLDAGKELEVLSSTVEGPKWIQERIFSDYKAAGYHMSKLPDAERIKWAESVPDLGAEWATAITKKGYPGWEIMQRYQEITTQLGYEWPRNWAVQIKK